MSNEIQLASNVKLPVTQRFNKNGEPMGYNVELPEDVGTWGAREIKKHIRSQHLNEEGKCTLSNRELRIQVNEFLRSDRRRAFVRMYVDSLLENGYSVNHMRLSKTLNSSSVNFAKVKDPAAKKSNEKDALIQELRAQVDKLQSQLSKKK